MISANGNFCTAFRAVRSNVEITGGTISADADGGDLSLAINLVHHTTVKITGGNVSATNATYYNFAAVCDDFGSVAMAYLNGTISAGDLFCHDETEDYGIIVMVDTLEVFTATDGGKEELTLKNDANSGIAWWDLSGETRMIAFDNGKKIEWEQTTGTPPTTTSGGGSRSSGTALITSTTQANDTPTNATISVSGVQLDKTSATINVDEILQLIASITPDNATNKGLAWTSSDPVVASVDANGRVTAHKDGTVTITVTTDDGNFIASCVVTVTGTVDGGTRSIPGFEILTAAMGLLCAAVLFKWQQIRGKK